MLPSTITRRFLAAAACGALAVSVVALPGTTAAASEKERAGRAGGGAGAGTLTNFGFDASSYGSRTTGNPVVDSGPTALSVLPCTRYVPRSNENVVAEAGDGAGVELQGITTRNWTAQAHGKTSAFSRVHIASGTLAGGDVAFTGLTGRVRSFHDADGFHVRTISQVGSLSVAGVPVVLPPGGGPVEITVPGVGELVVHRTVRHRAEWGALGSVNVLRFTASDGTTERVGRAFARIDGQIEGGLFHGAAWGSDARAADGVAILGRAALRPMPCPGTRGKVLTNDTARATFDFGFLGIRRSSVFGEQRENGSAAGYSRSRVVTAGFGNGMLRFRGITAVADVTRRADGTVVRSARGTGVARILIDDELVSVPAGVVQEVPGVGSFTVRSVDRTPNGIDVTAVTVRLHNGTPGDTTDDTVVNLGRAKLAIQRG